MLKGQILSNLRTRYKGSFLGFLWTFVNPLLMLCVYATMFSTIMRVDMENYVMFLFVGLLAWTMFQSSVLDSVNIIVGNSNLVKKIYFPREILPIAQVLATVVNYFLSLFILIAALYITGIHLTINIIYLPLIVLIQTIFALGLAFLVSSLNVYFRDLNHILGIVMMAWFYFTPVLYNSEMIPDKFKSLFQLNPMATLIMSYQDVFFKGTAPNLNALMNVSITSIVVLLLGWGIFNLLNKGFAEEV
ncbi:ABC transporter permease [Paenibacillus ginsengihumi]|uniref:ABC transporter permease n=1 Tax=Paenibacillus ginsengihumi TaxID=431596 RepID=UPI001FE1EE2A|nr:ABC transporter permease [Paenibacillus ginsengihumi]